MRAWTSGTFPVRCQAPAARSGDAPMFDETQPARAVGREDRPTKRWGISTVALATLLSLLAWAFLIGSIWLL